MNFKKKPVLSSIIFLSMIMVFIWAVVNLWQRYKSEKSNNNVEICVEWKEIIDITRENGYSLDDFLKRIKAIGVTSVLISEETISSLISSGEIIFFPSEEYKRIKLLDIVSAGTLIKENSIMVYRASLAGQISKILNKRYNVETKIKQSGNFWIIYTYLPSYYVSDFWQKDIFLGFSDNKISRIKKMGFNVAANPVNYGNPEWIKDAPSDISSFLWYGGSEIPGFSGKEEYIRNLISENNVKFVKLEFNSFFGLSTLQDNLPDKMVLGHTISLPELGQNTSNKHWIRRWVRAVRERGNRFLYFHFLRQETIEGNLTYLRGLAFTLKKHGFELAETKSPDYRQQGRHKLFLILAFLCAISFPLLGITYNKLSSDFVIRFLITNAIVVVGGIIISVLMFDLYFMQKIISFPAVKTTLILPIFMSVFLIFKPKELKEILNKNVKIWHIGGAVCIFVVMVILLIRSGNYSFSFLNQDAFLREMMEKLLFIRPRTKEFLIGQPMLLLGYYFKKPILIWIGVIGQISIMNTFLHAHSPVSVSLIRTFHGIWAGFLIGLMLIALYNFTVNKIVPKIESL